MVAPATDDAPERAHSVATVSEWPTWAMLIVAYALWSVGIGFYEDLGPLGLIALSGVAATLHASLQHECLHGHPTRSPALNEALVFPSLTLLFPYRRFKELHLRHHRDDRLTDPYDDPESWYLAEGDYAAASPWLRKVLAANATLGGRMLLGPWLSAFGMWRSDRRAARKSRRAAAKMRDAYLRHALGVSLTLGAAWAIGRVDALTYLLFVSWPGVALLMVRTYVEHRAEKVAAHRTAIVDAEPFFALLFLNNNLHAVHHERPRLAWHELPKVWRREQPKVLAENGGYFIPGYLYALKQWFLRPREPIAHPFLRRSGDAADVAAPALEAANDYEERMAEPRSEPRKAGGAAA